MNSQNTWQSNECSSAKRSSLAGWCAVLCWMLGIGFCGSTATKAHAGPLLQSMVISNGESIEALAKEMVAPRHYEFVSRLAAMQPRTETKIGTIYWTDGRVTALYPPKPTIEPMMQIDSLLNTPFSSDSTLTTANRLLIFTDDEPLLDVKLDAMREPHWPDTTYIPEPRMLWVMMGLVPLARRPRNPIAN